MTSYHVQRPAPHRVIGVVVGAVLVGALLSVAATFAYAPLTVRVDGVRRTFPLGTRMRDVAGAGVAAAPRGDLRAVDGKVLEARGGGLPRMAADGVPVPEEGRLWDGAVLTSARGDDITETVETTLVAIPIKVIDEGTGPDVTVRQLGSAGLARARVGSVSRIVVDSSTWETGTPMVRVRSGAPAGDKPIALTFDDGPWPGQTEAILGILADQGVHATFFMLGVRARGSPALAKRVVEAGNVVGNHSQTHVLLGRANDRTIRYEMTAGANSIQNATGVRPIYFRPPGGSAGPGVYARARALGERVVGWGVDPGDWRRPPARFIVQRVVGAAKPGAVILLHDGGGDRSQTIGALPAIIRTLRSQGYRFVTLDELYGK